MTENPPMADEERLRQTRQAWDAEAEAAFVAGAAAGARGIAGSETMKAGGGWRRVVSGEAV